MTNALLGERKMLGNFFFFAAFSCCMHYFSLSLLVFVGLCLLLLFWGLGLPPRWLLARRPSPTGSPFSTNCIPWSNVQVFQRCRGLCDG
jgi:hypothetical protein